LFREAAQLSADALRLAAAQGEPLTVLHLAEQQRALALQQQILRKPLILPAALQTDYDARRAHLRALVRDHVSGPVLDAAVASYIELLLHGRHYRPVLTEVLAEELDLNNLRAALSACYTQGWIALIYVSSGADLLALTLDAQQLALTRIPLDRPLLRLLKQATLPRYRAYTYQDMPFQSGQHASPWMDLAALGEHLIPDTVRAGLHPNQRLLIIPSGQLHSVPWAALRVGGQWLVEQAIIQVLPGLQIWPALAQRVPSSNAALLIGVRSFGERAAELTSAIPSLDLVQRHWPGVVRRMEDGAVTRENLRLAAAAGELQNYGLIHLATHGQQVPGHGIMAHLKLADDDLLVDEVAQMHLGGALVVLVACEGALGETLPGEELLSLNRALLAAGARDVIASLWQLYDLMLLPILERLYTALTVGLDAPTALAHAQRECLAIGNESPQEPLATPLVWASLCAIGAGI
jgi:hypothetical protein